MEKKKSRGHVGDLGRKMKCMQGPYHNHSPSPSRLPQPSNA